jgi:hypothetical protein
MTLWCAACGMAHKLTAGSVERIVYTLDAQVLDERTKDFDREDEGLDPMLVDPTCLLTVLASSWSSEGYAEWVENPVLQRREADRLARTSRADGDER